MIETATAVDTSIQSRKTVSPGTVALPAQQPYCSVFSDDASLLRVHRNSYCGRDIIAVPHATVSPGTVTFSTQNP